MAERFKALVLKTKVISSYRGFKSHFALLSSEIILIEDKSSPKGITYTKTNEPELSFGRFCLGLSVEQHIRSLKLIFIPFGDRQFK